MEIRKIIKQEYINNFSFNKGKKYCFIKQITRHETWYIFCYLKMLRYEEFWHDKYISTNRKIYRIISYFYERRKNRLGLYLGFEIPKHCLGYNATIYHKGTVVIHPNAKIGEGCRIHGNLCLGNSGRIGEENLAPVLGSNVDIGTNVVILGNVKVGNSIQIGASSVITKSFVEPGCVLVGIPAQIVRRKE